MAAITGQYGAFWGPKKDPNGKLASSVAFAEETTTRQADNKTYIIDDPDLRYWDKAKPLVVEESTDGGSSWTPVASGFTVQHAGGIVVFDEADATRDVRVSGYAYELEEKMGFFSWTLTIDVVQHEVANFQTDGWVENVPGNKSWTAQAEQHWNSTDKLDDWIGELLPVTFFVDDQSTRKWRYEGVGYISQDAVTTPQGELVTRTIRFTGDGPVWRRAG